ncbi:bifunctional 4-hydroxy-2-oxoglutarate aldolase/2-dehydro-3-deoxy-phosphogluconate aldolase [Ideonella sp. B508-1]|uniref:bifunctional 4-hydroxy-2-oxoglutarate aldolase/2-dehydro-3-deoxy-phosphogluconate aldolase n=1 Tax=Ideonella sp. B508-1 TaxID=137716 RepID=UPI000346DBAE|nr:bifunctional 4-hydroxy-2-oxoglutarate aldolase/2-dehydro-3-deoxy-phosphogluconate aldolase [Ideonella sp. B508-1]
MSTTLPALPAFRSRVVPVVVLQEAAHAVPLAQALLAGGIDVIEITLRTPCALEAIAAVARDVPDMQVGAGTLLGADDVRRAQDAGARFGLSPGHSPALLQAVAEAGLPFVPGVMTPGEVMAAREAGYRLMKLFPATVAGGLDMLKALASPFGDVRFCPTGGVSLDNLGGFLKQPNVALVGGSWLAPAAALQAGDWAQITTLARQAMALSAG